MDLTESQKMFSVHQVATPCDDLKQRLSFDAAVSQKDVVCKLKCCDCMTKDCRYSNFLSGAISFAVLCLSFTMSISKHKLLAVILVLLSGSKLSQGFASEFDKTEEFMDKIGLEKSIPAEFNKVAYGSTTKRSIPDNAYPVTTLATPLLTIYRYSDGNDEWLRVDLKNMDANRETARSNVDFEQPEFVEGENRRDIDGYGTDLEKDHALPTSAPAADILKNNNNKNYNNPNRYNNDRLRPDYQPNNQEQVTENVYKTTTTYNLLRNVRPTKSMYSKDIPSYVPPSRAFFTPPLPPEYQNPFADNPTLRGTNSDSFANRRPIPPPSLMPNKDRIPFRPDLPKVNMEKVPERVNNNNEPPRPANPIHNHQEKNEKKKSLNTPSQNVKLGEFYGLNRSVNESNFEYEKSYVPSRTRILSGSNGRHDDIPDILLRTVTATPNVHRTEPKVTKTRAPNPEPSLKMQEPEIREEKPVDKLSPKEEMATEHKEIIQDMRPVDRSESVTVKKDGPPPPQPPKKKSTDEDVTTQMSDTMNLANFKEPEGNVTKANSDAIWRICWIVHIYLVVICYVLLAVFSIYKLIRYENDPHMFSKSYFLTIHLMLTVICVLRIFYLLYDPYNERRSFNIFLYDFLHSFPLSLLATTFAVLILFLLKRTLTHLEVKTRPGFLVVFALLHIVLCFCLTICKPVFVLLAWALGVSYLYLYRIIKNVLAKKSQNLSEMCSQNISYASHITIAVALLFVLLGCVQLYALFFIKVDRFNGEIKHHWILLSFELSVRFIEISIITTLLAIVVSLRMSQREKQSAGGFPLFPCTTSDSSTDNIYPNNCNTNPNALNYSRQEMILDNIPTEPVERPNLLKHAFQRGSNFDRFERPKWGSERFDSRQNIDQNNFIQPNSGNFERGGALGSLRNESRNSARKMYDSAKFYNNKPKYDVEYKNEDYDQDGFANQERNIYSEPLDNHHQYERTVHDFELYGEPLDNHHQYERTVHDFELYSEPLDNHHQYERTVHDFELYSEPLDNHHQYERTVHDFELYSEPLDNHHQYERTVHDFERGDFDRRSRNSSNTSGRRSTGRARKNHARPHLGIQTLPNHDRHQLPDSMLVDEQGFVRFRHMQEEVEKPKKMKKQNNDPNHYSEA